MCGVGSTFVAASFGYFCLRRRVCDCCSICCEADVEVSEPPGRTVEVATDNTELEVTRVRYDEVDSGWHEDWSTRLHRPRGSTSEIIRKVFSMPRKASLGQEWIGETGKESKRPEYVAIPARMTQSLGEVELAKGQFSGDTAEHFNPIYRQSKLMSFKLTESPPVSPHYLASDVLRSSHSPQRAINPIQGSCGDARSPPRTNVSSAPPVPRRGKARQNSPSPRKPSSLSSLTSGTSAEASTEGVRSPDHLPLQLQQNPFPDRITEPIYTIHETCSSISSDSLVVDTNVHTRSASHAHNEVQSSDERTAHRMSCADNAVNQSSPKLEDPTYRGFLQNFRIDHIL